MAADVRIVRVTGPVGSQTVTDITTLNTRANAMDSHSTNDTGNPVQIPASGFNYSFWVVTRLKANSSPSGTINNIKWYSDGANNFGTGITCKGNTATSYVQATGTVGVTGNQLTTASYSTLSAAPGDVFASGFNSSNPKSVNGSISNPSTGEFGNYFVYQIAVDNTATAGQSGQETFTWKYDET